MNYFIRSLFYPSLSLVEQNILRRLFTALLYATLSVLIILYLCTMIGSG